MMFSMMRQWCGCALILALVWGCGDSEGGSTTGTADGGSPGTGGSAGATGGHGGTGGSGGTASGDCSGRPRGALPFTVGGETHCYWLVDTGAPQIDANTMCGADGYLVTIHSSAENDHAVTVAAGTTPVWTGLRCDQNPGAACTADPASNYEWMNGEPFDYDAWASGEPANPRGAALHDDGAWYGYDSLNNTFAYICEAPPE